MQLRRHAGAATSVFLAGCALTRATSYLLRTPNRSASTDLIESVIDYRVWGIILVTAAAAVCFGVVTRGTVSMWCYFAGHCVLMGCYSVFGISILVAALAFDASWTTLGEVVVVATLHTIRVLVVVVGSARPARER